MCAKAGRNDPCHCGSGKKYKKCCLEKDEANQRLLRQSYASLPAGNSFSQDEQALCFFSDLDELNNTMQDKIEQGQLDAAEKLAQQLLAEFPEQPDGSLGMGLIQMKRKQFASAAEYFAKTIKLTNSDDFDPSIIAEYKELECEARQLAQQPPNQPVQGVDQDQ
jgi:tetratricopeptide (TPR) repeat protein